MNHHDFLVEIHTEELPPKHLSILAQAFLTQIKLRLEQAALHFKEIKFYATPRRLAVLVKALDEIEPARIVERRGPSVQAAYDKDGNPTRALIGFAKSCGVEVTALEKITNKQGEWFGIKQHTPGKAAIEYLPEMVSQSLAALPITKPMRWNDHEVEFIRPIHSVVMLYGKKVIDCTILGYKADRITEGHRFHSPEWIKILEPADYESVLTKAKVMADFKARRHFILEEAKQLVEKQVGKDAELYLANEALLDEVTGLVEWPVVLCGKFDVKFLNLPKEVPISAMQDHQRYFPIVDKAGKLLPYFIMVSNIQSKEPERVVHGNERVLRARLADAAFFYETDKKESLADRIPALKGMVFKAKLGTLYDKAERLSKLGNFVALKLKLNATEAHRAGLLAKTDLTTHMVAEFPELQGLMGYYYANHDGESEAVAEAIKEQYLPRFAGDTLPQTKLGAVLAIVDRVDTLVGAFGMNQLPTGEKDPYGLRRAALALLRILIENEINLDLAMVLEEAVKNYPLNFENKNLLPMLFEFMQERLRAWYIEQGVSADVFSSVAVLSLTNPFDVHKRIRAVQAFKKLNEAEALSIANKRVSNILAKYAEKIEAHEVNPSIFEDASEKELARQLEEKRQRVEVLKESAEYEAVLMQLAELRHPIDNFFDHVMVMTDDKSRRENRLLLLNKLRALFLQVADIALLQ